MFVHLCITKEALATIREVLEADLDRLYQEGECEKDLIHCIQVMDALEELPDIK